MDMQESIHLLIGGHTVYTTDVMADLVQTRRHRKKRINKKWRKRYGMKIVPWNWILVDRIRGDIYCHPKILEVIKSAMQARE